jgi:hypothetical protein
LNNSPPSDPLLYRLKTVAVHLALLRTGKVVLFSGDHEHIEMWTKGESSIWDPEKPNQSDNNPTLGRNLFCSGHCFLPDGRLLVAGGQSTNNHPVFVVLSALTILPAILKLFGKEAADHDIHTFHPEKEEWHYHRHIKMPKARWYPTCVTLPDGKGMIVSGTYAHAFHSLFGGFINIDYEIFDPSTNTLSKPSNFIEKIELYPFLHVLPGGLLFVHSKDTTHFWDIVGGKLIADTEFHTESKGTRTYPGMGSSVLLPLDQQQQQQNKTTSASPDTARILLVGGSTSNSPNNDTDATDIAEIFTVDLRNPANSPGWNIVSSNPIKRFLSDSVLLPDGTVLVTNGAKKGVADDNKEAVKEIELFDPNDNSWTVIGTLQKPRLYHSSAVLLPDGRVLVAGSTGHHWIKATISPVDHFEHNVEIINPPYLQRDSSTTPRPTIETFPPSIKYRSSFEVTIAENDVDDIKMVSLIRLSSTTHNNNMDQRCILLSIMDRTVKTLKLSTPKDGSWAPPGHYMLFVVNRDRVPSIGKIIQVGY